MSKKASKPQDQTTSDEEKSDEFKNFERAIDRTLSLPKDEVERNMREAIEFHLEGLRQEGYAVPEPHTYSTYVEVPV